MIKRTRPHVTYANRMATISVLGVVGGLLLAAPASHGAGPPSVAAQPNGKVLTVVPRGETLAVVRLRRNGRVDRDFGERGFASTTLGRSSLVTGMLVQPSGAINLVVRFQRARQIYQYIVQLTSDGKLDRGFDHDGIAQPFEGQGVVDTGGLAMSGDGQLLAGAAAANDACYQVPATGCEYTQLVAKLDATGALVAGFGDQGIARVPLYGTFVELTAAPDGSIVVSSVLVRSFSDGLTSSSVSRLTPSGSLDTTFGAGSGHVEIATPVNGVAVSETGSIYVGGGSEALFGFAALLANGSPDSAFGTGGAFSRLVGRPVDAIGGFVQLSDGDLLASGPIATRCGPAEEHTDENAECQLTAGLLRVDPSGSPVIGFGKAGFVKLRVRPSAGRVSIADGVQPVDTSAGLRVATPWFIPRAKAASARAIVALRANGKLDRSYGDRGVAIIPAG